MASILLVFGAPDHGKSELAKKLETQYGFYRIEVDDVYADFVEALYPPPPSLNVRQFILPHYDGGYPTLGCGTGFRQNAGRRNHWHHHLLQQIEEAAAHRPKVVVEGYLLGDCRTFLHNELSTEHHVLHVRAEQHTYTKVDAGLTVAEVAALVDAE